MNILIIIIIWENCRQQLLFQISMILSLVWPVSMAEPALIPYRHSPHQQPSWLSPWLQLRHTSLLMQLPTNLPLQWLIGMMLGLPSAFLLIWRTAWTHRYQQVTLYRSQSDRIAFHTSHVLLRHWNWSFQTGRTLKLINSHQHTIQMVTQLKFITVWLYNGHQVWSHHIWALMRQIRKLSSVTLIHMEWTNLILSTLLWQSSMAIIILYSTSFRWNSLKSMSRLYKLLYQVRWLLQDKPRLWIYHHIMSTY